jgi:S1-C subfamily serine protease
MRTGDIITGIGDTTLDETHAYINTLFLYSPGDTLTLSVSLFGNQIQMDVTLGEASL